VRLKPDSEMSKLLWSFTIPVLLLVALIVVAYLIYGIVSTNNNAKRVKELMVEETVRTYRSMGNNFQNLSSASPELIKQFNADIVRTAYSGDPVPIYGLAKHMMLLTTPAKTVSVIKDGKVVDSITPAGITVDVAKLPVRIPAKGYELLESFSDKEGTFLVLFTPVDMTRLGINAKFAARAVFDLTDQIKKIDEYFQDQKQDTVVALVIVGIIALILFGLLSTFWLRYLINKYIRKPVQELNTAAIDIAEGTYEGEVVVDEHSDFAALQGLLKSGQLILRRLDEKMSDEE